MSLSEISIPSWMDEIAPGAADAARNIDSDNLTGKRRERLQRLVNHPEYNESNEAAWTELAVWRGKERPTDIEVRIAQYELFRAAFRAPDLLVITKTEIRERKAKLASIAKHFTAAVRELDRIVKSDEVIARQIADFWQAFRMKYADNPLIADLPDSFREVSVLLGNLDDFIDRTAKQVKPAGPAPHLGKMRGKNVQQTTVIRHIAETCEQLFGSQMYGTVAKLARASLGRDISVETVRRSMRGATLP